MENTEFDLDDVLNLEEEYYNRGYEDGAEQSTKEQYLEGRAYGLQTGFQRFLIIGIFKGLLEHWQNNIENYDNSIQEILRNRLEDLNKNLTQIKMTNDEIEVGKYEKLLLKCKNKIRIIHRLCKDGWENDNTNKIVKEVGGDLHVSDNYEEMW